MENPLEYGLISFNKKIVSKVPHTKADEQMRNVINHTLKGIRPKSLTVLQIIDLRCSSQLFEQFLDNVLNLVDPAIGLYTLKISML